MKFDYTFVDLFGFTLWEPMVAVTNLTLFFLSLYVYRRLTSTGMSYARHMAGFLLLIGTAAVFGAVAHGIHYDFGKTVFSIVVYVSNALSLVSAYFCFAATLTLAGRGKNSTPPWVLKSLAAWIALMLIVMLLWNNFVIVKIHAGVILFYSFVVHIVDWQRHKYAGSGLVVLGYLASFLSILVHSLGVSLHEYFNHKDLAHVFMILSMFLIYLGVKRNAKRPVFVSSVV